MSPTDHEITKVGNTDMKSFFIIIYYEGLFSMLQLVFEFVDNSSGDDCKNSPSSPASLTISSSLASWLSNWGFGCATDFPLSSLINETFLELFEPSDLAVDDFFRRSGFDSTEVKGKLWLEALRLLPGPSIKLGAKVTRDDFRLSEDPATKKGKND